MGAPTRNRAWWVFGLLVALIGICFLIGGALSGGPDVVGGIVFGGLFLLAGAVILWRRRRK